MEPNTEKIDKPDRIVVQSDADERKELIRERQEDKGLPPDVAAAQAEEIAERQTLPDEAVTGPLGERLGERFLRQATGDEVPLDPPPPAELEGVVVISTLEDLGVEDDPQLEDVEPMTRTASISSQPVTMTAIPKVSS